MKLGYPFFHFIVLVLYNRYCNFILATINHLKLNCYMRQKIFFFWFLTLLIFPAISCYTQYSESFCYKGSWSDWKYWNGNIAGYPNRSGLALRTAGGITYFSFKINNYVPPTKKEIKQHLKNNEWYTYSGVVKYCVDDLSPTIEDIARKNFFVYPDPRISDRPIETRESQCTIKIAPYKKQPWCYNIFFEDVGVALNIQGIIFQGE